MRSGLSRTVTGMEGDISALAGVLRRLLLPLFDGVRPI